MAQREEELQQLLSSQQSQGIVCLLLFVFSRATTIPSRKKKEMGVPEVGVSEEGIYCKIVFL